MACPTCQKSPSRSCRYPSQQHWSWCEEAERLRDEERTAALHFLACNQPILHALTLPDLRPKPTPYQGAGDGA